jgi:hypothetical protein
MYVNGEIIPVETIPGTGGDKGEWRRGWIQLWYIRDIVRTFVNAHLAPLPSTTIKINK